MLKLLFFARKEVQNMWFSGIVYQLKNKIILNAYITKYFAASTIEEHLRSLYVVCSIRHRNVTLKLLLAAHLLFKV